MDVWVTYVNKCPIFQGLLVRKIGENYDFDCDFYTMVYLFFSHSL